MFSFIFLLLMIRLEIPIRARAGNFSRLASLDLVTKPRRRLEMEPRPLQSKGTVVWNLGTLISPFSHHQILSLERVQSPKSEQASCRECAHARVLVDETQNENRSNGPRWQLHVFSNGVPDFGQFQVTSWFEFAL